MCGRPGADRAGRRCQASRRCTRRSVRRGLHVVAVSIDNPGKGDDIRKFLAEYKLTFEVLHDSTQAIQGAYQTTGVPETFIIAADGTIRKKVISAADWNSEPNRALITQLLKDAAE